MKVPWAGPSKPSIQASPLCGQASPDGSGEPSPRRGTEGREEGDPGITAGRSFAVLASTLALSMAFVFAWRLFGLVPALLGFLFIALDPFHVAHSRILHLDGMLSSFLLLALLAFLSFLRYRRALDLIVSGVAAGLSWLTKSPSLFLIPVVLLLALADLGYSLRNRDRRSLAALLWHSAWPLVVWGSPAWLPFRCSGRRCGWTPWTQSPACWLRP